MRNSYNWFLIFLAAPLMALSACWASAETNHPSVARALELEKQGQPAAAISLLEPLVQSGQTHLNNKDLGIACVVLAKGYQQEGNFSKAQRIYEQAIQLLAPIPDAISVYASALDNFGSLYKDQNQFDTADKLRQRALALYELASDHVGATFVLNNLAGTAIEQDDKSQARKYLEKTFEEMKRASNIAPGDRAAIYSNQGSLSLLEGQPDLAQREYSEALDLWGRAFGPNHYTVGWGLIMLAQADLASGHLRKADADVHTGSAILKKTLGSETKKYALAQIVYAHILNASGEMARAHAVESESRQSLQSLQHSSCSVSVEAFK